jgi:glycosyltransferase EpsH
MFLDSDDWIELNTCEIAYNKAKETSSEIVFWSWQKETAGRSYKDYYLEKNASILINNDIVKLKIRCVGLLKEELKDPVKTDHFNTPWAKLYRRTFLVDSKVQFIERKKVGMEDVLFNIELFQQVNKVSYIPFYFNHYRLDNPKSLTKVDTVSLFSKFNNLFYSIEKIIDTGNPKSKEALNNRIALSLINITLSITNNEQKLTLIEKLKQLGIILNNQKIKDALNTLEMRFLPLHWKIFFLLCKLRFVSGVYLLALIMRKLK